ncbi:MAG: hypothetical protein I8H75_00490 [Myxococcaceae bacterium]|nr:hypothetical protein [Myxococcaceae bacterium]MBH2005823.1 hypothetical protein [Myxococcaceae bacterium]
MSGPDATSFLHRLSTRDVFGAAPAVAFGNCFLTPKGRLIDVVHQITLSEGRWLLTSSHDRPGKLKSWFEQYLFSEQVLLHEYALDDSPETLSEKERIASCIPKFPNEINEDHNPFELGLGHWIDWNKGCYVGQEVISRLDTYDKVSHRLMAVACRKEDFERLRTSSEITSMSDEHAPNAPIALGVFRKADLTDGQFLITSSGVPVWVVSSAR